MREIKFRGRNQKEAWVFGGHFGVNDRSFIINFTKGEDGEMCHNMYEADTETVGQYTGKQHKNTKVFENDILRYSDGNPVYGIVRFGEYGDVNDGEKIELGFYIEWQDNGSSKWSKWWRRDLIFWLMEEKIEVIGNIHDNPDLIGGERMLKLPKPKVIDLDPFASTLEKEGYYPIESDLRATLYVINGSEIGIITHTKGYVRVNIADIPKICSELMGIYEDDRDRIRMGVKN